MSLVYTTLGLVEFLVLVVSFVASTFFVLRAIYRCIFVPKAPKPKPEDLRHLRRAGQSGLY